jgi:hypothetical protein
MRWLKIAIKIALAALLLFDAALATQFYHHGSGITITDVQNGSAPGEVSFRVVKNPFTIEDAWILAVLIGFHFLLIYLLWRFRNRRMAQVS